MTAPIACTLTPGEYADRIRLIEVLNRTALRAYALDGSTLVLTYAPAAAAWVRELAEHESRCCAFLILRVDETPDAIRLTVTAPDAADKAPAILLAPFVTGGDARRALKPTAEGSGDGVGAGRNDSETRERLLETSAAVRRSTTP